MVEQEEIMDEEVSSQLKTIVIERIKKEIWDNYYRLICEKIKGNDSDILFLSIGINKRESMPYQNMFCISLIELGYGTLGSKDRDNQGVWYIQPLLEFEEAYSDKSPAIIYDIAYEIAVYMKNKLVLDNILDLGTSINCVSEQAGCDIYRKRK